MTATEPDRLPRGKRARILEVAHDAIVSKGFDATSVEEIAVAVGISRAGFFYHFPDKNALARALLERHIETESTMLRSFVARAAELSDDPLQQILIIMRFMAEGYAEIPGGYTGCILASTTYQDRLFDAEVRALNRQGMLEFRDCFAPLFARLAATYPPKDPIDPEEMANMLNSIVEGAIIVARGLRDPEALVRQILLARQMVKAVYQPR